MTNISQWSCPTEIESENTENSIIRNENDKLSDDSNFLRCQNSEKNSNDQQYGKFEKNDQLNYQDIDNIYFKTKRENDKGNEEEEEEEEKSKRKREKEEKTRDRLSASIGREEIIVSSMIRCYVI